MKEKKSDIAKGNEAKREKLLAEKKKSPLVKIIVILLVAAIPMAWFVLRNSSEATSGSVSGTQVAEKVSYKNQNIRMTSVDGVAGSGDIEISADIVKDKKIVS